MHKGCVCVALATLVFLGLAAESDAQWTWTPQTGRWINVKRLPKETPELQVEYARTLLLQGDYKKALSETEKFDRFYADTDYAAENLFLRGEIKLAQGNFTTAAKEFQKVIDSYPESDRYEDVIAKQYEIGNKLYEKGEQRLQKRWRLFKKKPFKKAINVYSMVIDNQPFTDAAAEAQYKVGLCHHTREEYVEAAFEYRRVIEDYPASDWVDDASYGLATCYYDGGLPPDYDQTPSLLAIEAIDDFTARYGDDERGAELKAKRTEMRENIARQRIKTAQFYEKRREFDSARIYYTLVAEQFADTASAAEAKQWLDENPVTDERVDQRVLKASVNAS